MKEVSAIVMRRSPHDYALELDWRTHKWWYPSEEEYVSPYSRPSHTVAVPLDRVGHALELVANVERRDRCEDLRLDMRMRHEMRLEKERVARELRKRKVAWMKRYRSLKSPRHKQKMLREVREPALALALAAVIRTETYVQKVERIGIAVEAAEARQEERRRKYLEDQARALAAIRQQHRERGELLSTFERLQELVGTNNISSQPGYAAHEYRCATPMRSPCLWEERAKYHPYERR